MPKLKTLLACEKVIFDQEGPVSLINIFQRMNIQLSGMPLPEKAISPTMWSVFVLWETDPLEVGKTFTQMLRVTAPDGVVFSEHEGTFISPATDEMQVKTKSLIPGLPIWQEGMVTVNAWLKGDEALPAEYKFEVRYKLPTPNSETEQNHLSIRD